MTKLVPFSAIKPDAWPPQFRRLLDLRHAPSRPLETPNVAAGWRDTTFEFHLWNVGFFTGWLNWTGRFQEAAELQEYATPEIVGAYVDDMRGFNLSTRTIANRVDGVRAALAALSPGYETDWLMCGINRLRAEPSDRRRTGQRSQHTGRIVDAGMALMNEAVRAGSNQKDVERAILYRDGLMIVFLALAVPRLACLHCMALGQHLVEHDAVFRITWSAKEMKEAQAYEARLDPELSDLFRRYLDEFRPILVAEERRSPAAAGTALWIGRFGRPLERRVMYNAIITRTAEAFGESVFPHAFRHSAASSLALDRPDLISIATPLLQHQAATSRELYILADEFAASQKFGEALDVRRFGGRRGRQSARTVKSDNHGSEGDDGI
jgi:integrase/recombinase XerD